MNASFALKVDNSSSLRWGIDYPFQQSSSEPVAAAISLRGPFPAWLGPVAKRILEVAALSSVDPLGSRPMNAEDVRDALTFMIRGMHDETVVPWIGRLASGGLQLTWRAGNVEVEAVFDRARNDRELMVTVGENEWDAPIDQADKLFADVVERLSGSHLECVPA